MIKKVVAVFIMLFCVFGNKLLAQNEKNIWYFGDYGGLDFNSGSPVALSNSAMWTLEGCSSISDANGNILFYTNGMTVWDRNHAIMPNGDSLGADYSSTQAALIVPLPGSTSIYYIFTVDDDNIFSTHDFAYSIVDMSLNGGNGAVTGKDIYITSPVAEKISAVYHSNNMDVWVMVRKLFNNSFYCYKVTSAGLTAIPCVSSLGTILTDTDESLIGYMKFSADGTKIAYAVSSETTYVELFDFDASIGYAFNDKFLTLPPTSSNIYLGAYGIEFSKSGNYLYASYLESAVIYQWDITSNSEAVINSTIQQVASSPGNEYGALQMGPDGKIYCSTTLKNSVGAIMSPELPGILCNYEDSAAFLTFGDICNYGLPNFISSYFLHTGINTNNLPQNQLTVSPNPASDKLTITNKQIGEKTNYQVTISDITGRCCFQSQNAFLPVTISIKHLQEGIYFVKVIDGENYYCKKIVIEHI